MEEEMVQVRRLEPTQFKHLALRDTLLLKGGAFYLLIIADNRGHDG